MIESDEFRQLHDDLSALETIEAALSAEKKMYEAGIAGLRARRKALEAVIEQRKEGLRAWALAEYERTGKKSLSHGLGIREDKNLIYDKDIALAWAIGHQMALILDVAKFEKHAKVDPPKFVSITKENSVTFPMDRAKLLEE